MRPSSHDPVTSLDPLLASSQVVGSQVFGSPVLGDQVLGLVLCGGASKRMGTDKGALSLGGQSLVQRSATLLKNLGGELNCLTVALATGSRTRYEDEGHAVLLDAAEHQDMGPAAGLCAGLAHARSISKSWVVTIACDMPSVQPAALIGLVNCARTASMDACLFEHNGRAEPLLAVYHVRALGAVRRALSAGKARMIDFHAGFGALTVGRWNPGNDARAQDWAMNVNTPSEWRVARERESRNRESRNTVAGDRR